MVAGFGLGVRDLGLGSFGLWDLFDSVAVACFFLINGVPLTVEEPRANTGVLHLHFKLLYWLFNY